MSLCIASGSLLATLPLAAFTLVWTHSIEKTRWEEDWRIHDMKLELTIARIRGSGAGMEIPAGATLRDGVWHYVPMLLPQGGLLLRHSPYVTGYELCAENHCRPLADLLPGLKEIPGDNAIIELRPCPEGNKP
ncbi:MAG: DUF1850 domain-containing protein [Rhodocyclaceae bacterium]|nr:DUF1850 domain-containing protein [Rhodocyclaceae bacterium]